jgi:hypothetical protein
MIFPMTTRLTCHPHCSTIDGHGKKKLPIFVGQLTWKLEVPYITLMSRIISAMAISQLYPGYIWLYLILERLIYGYILDDIPKVNPFESHLSPDSQSRKVAKVSQQISTLVPWKVGLLSVTNSCGDWEGIGISWIISFSIYPCLSNIYIYPSSPTPLFNKVVPKTNISQKPTVVGYKML